MVPCRPVGRPARRAGLAIGLSAALLGACGGSPTLDIAMVEHAAAASILAQHHMRVTVRCPEGVPERSGFTFWCSADLEVGSYPLLVTETNGAGGVRYENSAPLVALDIGKVERAISASVRKRRRAAAIVRCPQEVIQRAGVVFFCTALVDGGFYRVRVLETDGEGHVRYVGLA